MKPTTTTEALAHAEWEQRTEGHGAVGVTVDTTTLQEMMGVIETFDLSLRSGWHLRMGLSSNRQKRSILRIAKEMRKARRDWKKFLRESSKEAKA